MTVTSRNPGTGALLATFPSATEDDVARAVARARGAQSIWARACERERQDLFERLKAVVRRAQDDLVDLIHHETGKVARDAEPEVADIVDDIDYYLAESRKWAVATPFLLNSAVTPNSRALYEFVPHGVIGLIMPWNFSFYTPTVMTCVALMAGNAVIFKPSEHSSMIGLQIGELFEHAGFPKDLVTVVLGADETGAALARSRVDKIFFVGSVESGRKVIASANGTPVHVELGGNSAALVLADADVELAARGVAWGATSSSGQDCAGIKRIFVEEAAAEAFIERLVGIVAGLTAGVDYGPYISVQARDEVHTRIERAVSDNAMIYTGAELVEPGYWLTPSVLELSSLVTPLVQLETFGNAAPVLRVKDANEAVLLANRTEFGLSNAVFSRDAEKAMEIGRLLEAGMIFINDPVVPLPGWDHWTGWKASGFGNVESRYGQCVKKRVIVNNEGGRPRSFWYPD